MIVGLEVVPRRVIEYRGSRFEEMDLDAVLARHPQVALVDELAHTNVPGSRNAKRWQDIDELLDAGIDVISTVNIQHLESLNDVVQAITGIKQRETVPDSVVRAADQLELVDMTPEALRRRLAHGNVYKPEKVDAALGNYFRRRQPHGAARARAAVARRPGRGRAREVPRRARHPGHVGGAHADRRGPHRRTGGRDAAAPRRPDLRVAARAGPWPPCTWFAATAPSVRDRTSSRACASSPRTSAAPSTRSSATTSPLPSSTSRARSTARRSSSAPPGAAGSAPRCVPAPPTTSSATPGDIDVHVVSHERAGRTPPGDRRPRRVRIVAPGPGSSSSLIPIGLTWRSLPFRDSLSLSTVLLAFLLGVVAILPRRRPAPGHRDRARGRRAAGQLLLRRPGRHVHDRRARERLRHRHVRRSSPRSWRRSSTAVPRSSQEAARRRAEANVLASLSVGVLGARQRRQGLLDQACETFGMRSAALFETAPTAAACSWWRSRGTPAPRSVDDADVAVDAGPGLVMALSGAPLPASDRRMLDAFAAQTAAVLERNRLDRSGRRRHAPARVRRHPHGPDRGRVARPAHAARRHQGVDLDAAGPEPGLADADRMALLDNAADAADRLDSLLSNLLDLSRIQTGAVRPILEPVSLDEVLQQALRGVPDESVRDETDESLPLVLTDSGLLERAVANLVENARAALPAGRARPAVRGGRAGRVPAAAHRRPRSGGRRRRPRADVHALPAARRRAGRIRRRPGARRRPRPQSKRSARRWRRRTPPAAG